MVVDNALRTGDEPPCRRERQENFYGFSGAGAFDGLAVFLSRLIRTALHWIRDNRRLILDWEFAYAGSRLSDIGQLLRWAPSASFVRAFANAYNIAAEPRVREVSDRVALTLAATSR